MLKLYYSPIACSLAPHILLEELGLPFEPVRVSIPDGEHQRPEYLAVNPRGRVPALEVDGEIVTEVPTLLAFLASLRPEAGLVPQPGTLAFARCFEWLAFLSSSLHIAYAQFRRPERFLPPGAPAEPFSEHGRELTKALYLEIEQRLTGPWAVGEQYSIADPYLLPFYLWDVRVDLDVATHCPRWTAWKARVAERPAVQRAAQREGIEV